MWVKKFAAGVLAAALSLTLLSGCSGGRSGSVISEGETISIDTSASYRLVQYTGNIYLTYELECTNEKDGTKIYAGQANKARCFAGTHEAITMDVKAITSDQYKRTDADGNVIQPGLYTVNYKTKTYKEGGTFGSVEKVLAATAFCNYEKEAGTLKEVRAASGTKHKQEYYVELLKFDFGTAAVFYTKDHWKAGTTDCWVSVKQFSKNDTATACQDWLRSTRLGRGSIKSHVRTVKVLGMGLFAFQERIHLWKGVTH